MQPSPLRAAAPEDFSKGVIAGLTPYLLPLGQLDPVSLQMATALAEKFVTPPPTAFKVQLVASGPKSQLEPAGKTARAAAGPLPSTSLLVASKPVCTVEHARNGATMRDGSRAAASLCMTGPSKIATVVTAAVGVNTLQSDLVTPDGGGGRAASKSERQLQAPFPTTCSLTRSGSTDSQQLAGSRVRHHLLVCTVGCLFCWCRTDHGKNHVL